MRRAMRGRAVFPLVGGLASGILLSLAFPPFGLPFIGLLGLPFLLLLLTDEERLARRTLLAGLAGVAFFAIHLWWIAAFGWYALAALVLVQTLFFAVFGAVVGAFDRVKGSLPRALGLGGAWIGLEMLRGTVPFGGFPWGTLGSSLHDFDPARAAAAWVGTSGLSALLVTAGSLAATALAYDGGTLVRVGSIPLSRRGRAVGALALLIAVFAFPFLMPRPEAGSVVRIAIVQAGVEAPWTDPADPVLVLARHADITRGLAGERLDLVLWGENVVEGGASLQTIAQLSAEIGIPLASGAVEREGSGWLNLVIAADPEVGEIGRYAKQRPVPFGEYVPLRFLLGGVPVLAREIPQDMIRGRSLTLLRYRFGRGSPVVSYESAFPTILRKAKTAGAEFIEVHTNNSSFGRSAASEQHLALDQMRAAELGVPVARAAITGISALIDSRGEIVARLGLYKTGILRGEIRLAKFQTLYASVGDWALAYPMIVVAFGLAWGTRVRSNGPIALR